MSVTEDDRKWARDFLDEPPCLMEEFLRAHRLSCQAAERRAVIKYLVVRSMAASDPAVLKELDFIRDELRAQ